jgi:hypothetical protein
MGEQDDNLERVSRRIGASIVKFYQQKKSTGRPEFYAGDLREYVVCSVGHALAPASPDRILRDLRKRKVLDYKVISRSQSLYAFVWNDQTELELSV